MQYSFQIKMCSFIKELAYIQKHCLLEKFANKEANFQSS